MPKQIIKDEIDSKEKLSRIFAVISMGLSLVFAGLLIFMLPSLMTDESPLKAGIISGVYFLFTASCIAHCTVSFISYISAQNFSGIFQALISLICSFLSLLNLRFVLAMLFSGLNMDSAAAKVIGDRSMTAFVELQSSNWTCMIFALVIMFITGIFGIARLAKR